MRSRQPWGRVWAKTTGSRVTEIRIISSSPFALLSEHQRAAAAGAAYRRSTDMIDELRIVVAVEIDQRRKTVDGARGVAENLAMFRSELWHRCSLFGVRRR